MTKPWIDDAILAFIDTYRDRHGYSPTLRELQEFLGQNTMSSVSARLARLRDDGCLEWVPHRPRTITVTERGRQRIAARTEEPC